MTYITPKVLMSKLESLIYFLKVRKKENLKSGIYISQELDITALSRQYKLIESWHLQGHPLRADVHLTANGP